MNKVTVYGAGGCGISIVAKEVERLKADSTINLHTKYIDTSRADIDTYDLDPRDVFVVTNTKVDRKIDGSGGVREALDVYITEAMQNYMDKLEYSKTDINIVISSASGGSGSLIAPRLIHNLKAAGCPVLYIVLADTSSVTYCETTIKTLKHIDLMGRKYKYTVPTMLIDNSDAIKVVDRRVGINAELLSLLVSATHKALDSADNVMFASNGYDKDTYGMVTLSVHTAGAIDMLKGKLISTLRVLSDDEYFKIDTNELDKVKQYKIGFLSDEMKARIGSLSLSVPLYFAITPNSSVSKIEYIKSELEKKLTIKEDKQHLFHEDEDIGVNI